MTTEKQYRELGEDEPARMGDEMRCDCHEECWENWRKVIVTGFTAEQRGNDLGCMVQYRRPVTPDAVAGNGGEVK